MLPVDHNPVASHVAEADGHGDEQAGQENFATLPTLLQRSVPPETLPPVGGETGAQPTARSIGYFRE